MGECEFKRKGECRASIKLDELDNFVEQVDDHTYPPSATKCETTKDKYQKKSM